MPTEPTNDLPEVYVNVLSLTYVEKETTSLDPTTRPLDVDGDYLTRAEVTLEPEFEAGDVITWAIEERKAQYAANTPVPLATPPGLENLTVTITSASTSPTTPNKVTIVGIAPFAAYKMALDSLKFTNMGPLITNTERRIVYKIWDDLGAQNEIPAVFDETTAGISVRYMNLVNVNDPPVANPTQPTLVLETPGEVKIGQMLATDPDSPTIWFNVTCLPGKGVVTVTDVNTGAFSYAHDPEYPGTDTFVFFAWDGELNSKFATVTIRTGSGVHAPVSSELTIEAWENSATASRMPATDADGEADIYRYQIVAEPQSPASLTLTDETVGLFRHNANGAFKYLAASSSAVVRRVAEAMENLPSDFDYNAVRGRTATRATAPTFSISRWWIRPGRRPRRRASGSTSGSRASPTPRPSRTRSP